ASLQTTLTSRSNSVHKRSLYHLHRLGRLDQCSNTRNLSDCYACHLSLLRSSFPVEESYLPLQFHHRPYSRQSPEGGWVGSYRLSDEFAGALVHREYFYVLSDGRH